MKTIVCDNCATTHRVESLRRSCSNCFLCTGCEIYRCPDCQQEIIITPISREGYSQATDIGEKPC